MSNDDSNGNLHIEEDTDLLSLNPEMFEMVVRAEARDELPAALALQLRSPRVRDHWYRTLVTIKRNIEAQFTQSAGQLAARSARTHGRGTEAHGNFLESVAKAKEWRARSARALVSLEARIIEAKYLTGKSPESKADAATLRAAIEEHRKAVLSDEDSEPMEADLKLWQVLERQSPPSPSASASSASRSGQPPTTKKKASNAATA